MVSNCLTLSQPCQVSLVVRVCASHVVCLRFAPRLGHTKDHYKYGTNCLHAGHTCVRGV